MRDNLKINGKCNNERQSMRFVVIKIINTYYILLKERFVLGLNDINFLLFILYLIQFFVYFDATFCPTHKQTATIYEITTGRMWYTPICVFLLRAILYDYYDDRWCWFFLLLCLCWQWMYHFFKSAIFSLFFLIVIF